MRHFISRILPGRNIGILRKRLKICGGEGGDGRGNAFCCLLGKKWLEG